MKKVVAMYEREEAYAKNLAEYVNRKENIPFEVQVFSEPDKLSAYLKGHTPQMLLLSEGSGLDEYGELSEQAERVMYLTEHKDQVQEDHIYKYQPTDQILNQLMLQIDGKNQRDSPILQSDCAIYGVYSPIGRCGKTTFSLLLSELLSKRRSVLYIGFDELSFWDSDGDGLEEQAEKGTLSDAYFYAERNALKEKMSTLVSHWHGVDLLTGLNCPEDLCAISAKEWVEFVQEIGRQSGYSVIVIDMGTKLWLADAMFPLCCQIFMPVLPERLARDKQKHFKEWMEKNGKVESLNRLQMVELPASNQNGTMKERLEYALWGETGDYVRSLIKGEW